MTTKEQVKQLWKKCFDDTKEFIEMYFRLRYTDDVNMVLRTEGRVISALQLIPYPMTFMGEVIPTAYISGACTDPDFRGKGVMKQLLSDSFLRMTQQKVPLSTLIPAEPWLFDYYKKAGYATVFSYSLTPLRITDNAKADNTYSVVTPGTFEAEAYQYYNRKQAARPLYLQHTEEDFNVILEDLFMSGGKYFIAKQQEEIKGIAFAVPHGTEVIINELVAENEESKQALVNAVHRFFTSSNVVVIAPPAADTENHQLGMARIIDAEKILTLYAKANPNEVLRIEVIDSILTGNSGYYRIENGDCIKDKEKKEAVVYTPTDVSELTLRIFSKQKPYMSLMLN